MATYNSPQIFCMFVGKILGASKVTVRFQVTVPEEARKLLKLKEGQTLVFVDDEGKVILKTEI